MKRKIISISISLALIAVAFMVSGFLIRNKPEPKRNVSRQEVLYVKTQEALSSEIHPEANYRGRVSSLENVSQRTP